MGGLWVGLLVVVVATLLIAGAGRLVQLRLRTMRKDHSRRASLWNRFYALNWGETATNNYGYAPADPDNEAPDRYQRQLYREMLKLLRERKPLPPGARLVEVSCGRGGGLRAFLDAAGPGAFVATGLDVATAAISHCRLSCEGREGVDFVEGNAMSLPFPDASVDVLLNVEAANDYPDRARFFSEVRRVLKPDGIFLYADTEKARNAGRMARDLDAAGFRFDLKDITPNVAEACRLDTPRRQAVIRKQAPLLARLLFSRDLGNYAAVEGSTKYGHFVSGERRYHMTAAVPA